MKKSFILLAAIISAVTVLAQEAQPEVETENNDAFSSWTIGAGISYRNFHKTKFSRSSAGSFSDYVVYGGEVHPSDTANLKSALEEKVSNPLPATGVATLDFASFSGSGTKASGKWSSASKFGPAVTAETGLYAEDTFNLGLEIGLQYFNMDNSKKGGAAGTLDYFGHHVGWTGAGSNISVNGVSTVAFTGAEPAIGTNGRTRFDMDLFVLDLGVKAGLDVCDGLSLFVAAGPSLSIANMKSSNSSYLTSGGVVLLRNKRSDNKTQLRLGYYLAGGAQYKFDENWGVSAELRYDDAFGKVGTRYAKQSLETIGGVLKVAYSF